MGRHRRLTSRRPHHHQLFSASLAHLQNQRRQRRVAGHVQRVHVWGFAVAGLWLAAAGLADCGCECNYAGVGAGYLGDEVGVWECKVPEVRGTKVGVAAASLDYDIDPAVHQAMNEYCKHKILQFHKSFIDRSFDQDDVALLVVLTREYTKKRGVLRELGDFLAHPKKDRGIVLNSVESAATFFEINCLRCFEDPNFPLPVVAGLEPKQELLAELLGVFHLAGLPKSMLEPDDDCFRDFVFCVIFLLSSFKVKYGGRLLELTVEYSHSLTLLVAYESPNFPTHLASLPILFLPNVWIQCPTFSKQLLRKHIARRFEEGALCAIAYEDDLEEKLLSATTFDRGSFWPLPNMKKS
jgi:hypothetical protein